MPTGLERVFTEFNFFFAPLREAVSDDVHLSQFLARFGYDAPQAFNAIEFAAMSVCLTQLNDAVQNQATGQQLLGLAKQIFSEVRTLESTGTISGTTLRAGFFDACLDLLISDYLEARAPVARGALVALGAIAETPIKAPAAGPGVDYLEVRCRWDRLRHLIENPQQWASEAYGWGSTNFDFMLAAQRLASLVDSLGGNSIMEELPASAAAAFGISVPSGGKAWAACFPALERQTGLADDGLTLDTGLMLLPVGNLGATNMLGLGVTPYADGALDGTASLSPQLTVKVETAAAAAGGALLVLKPGHELSVLQAAGVSAPFELGFVYGYPGGSPIMLLGDAAGSHLKASKGHLSVAGALASTPDLHVAGGFEGLTAVIRVDEDGFLSKIVSGPITIDAGNVLAGWRSGRGVYFEGGTNLQISLPVGLKVGGLEISEFKLGLDVADNPSIAATVSANLNVGPLFARVEGLGIAATLKPDINGLFGRYDLEFGLKKPTGYAVELDAAPIVGGGYLSADGDEYRGALALRLRNIGLSALAILNAGPASGAAGYSFVASISANVMIPLGQGFFLTGIGGVIGLNRTADTDEIRAQLFGGGLDNFLFPPAPIEEASTILANMAAMFPVKVDTYLAGPMARIEFGRPPLVVAKIGLILEVDRSAQPQRLVIIGMVRAQLPSNAKALIDLRLTFFGNIDFTQGRLSFDADLQGSRILTFPLSGKVHVRGGWRTGAEQLFVAGKMSPGYPIAESLPSTLDPLTVNFGTNNPNITLTCYQAMTLNSVQFGARMHIHAEKEFKNISTVSADGEAGFDALIFFHPFAFDVSFYASLQLIQGGKVRASASAALRLTGPNMFVVDGEVSATVLGMSVTVPIRHSWGCKESEPASIVDAGALLLDALGGRALIEAVPPGALSDGVVFAKRQRSAELHPPLNPMGGMRVVQRAVPLGVSIEKIGEALLAAPVTLSLRVSDGAKPLSPAPVKIEFVRGHYLPITDGERLAAPAFEQFRAGFEVAPDSMLEVDASKAVGGDLQYEAVQIPAEPVPTPGIICTMPRIPDGVWIGVLGSCQADIGNPLNRRTCAVPDFDPVSARSPSYVPVAAAGAGADPIAFQQDVGLAGLVAAAARAAQSGPNPVVAGYFMPQGGTG
jgi:hypothetical protein